MKFALPFATAALAFSASCTASTIAGTKCNKGPHVVDHKQGVTYNGLDRNGIEVFLGIPFGQDTGGANRFKPPKPYKHVRGAVVDATSYGPACPQVVGPVSHLLVQTDITEISEDCLNLVIGRPKGTKAHSKLPVMVWIYGGGFWSGQNREVTTAPDGMVLQSIENDSPVIQVNINYRLGFFGFAQSDALQAEGSENAGLRDQRLALEWIQEHIDQFGGDPENVTIFGQSSGGLAVGMQVLAYGGSKPLPFQRGICQSQCNEQGITGNFTLEAMQLVVDEVGCDKGGLHSAETIACFRDMDTDTLLTAFLTTFQDDIGHNFGDIWLPVVDGDFLPAAPSQLLREGKFGKATMMIGWTQDDLTLYTDSSIETDDDTRAYFQAYLPTVTSENIDKLLGLYPVSEFPANEEAGLSSELYRAARIWRDIIMVCQPMFCGENFASQGNDVYFYDWNQTVLDQVVKGGLGATGAGVIHTSEFAYIFGNISVYDTGAWPFQPSESDYALVSRGSRSWSTFAATGKPSRKGHDTFVGFTPAFTRDGEVDVFIVGGPHEGLSAIDGPRAKPALAEQRIRERCAFINSDEMVEQLRY